MAPVGAGAAFAAGVVSFLSPCVLPLVPGYISLMSGLSLEELSRGEGGAAASRRAALSACCFVAGFSLVFTLLGASASAVGVFLSSHLGVFSKLAGAAIILFGLHTTGLLPIRWLYYERRLKTAPSAGYAGAFVMGLAFAFGWTPCIGPILAGILTLAATQETVGQGMALLLVYSAGLGIPFIATGLGVERFLRFFSAYKRFIRWGEVAAGVLLLAVGALVFSNRLTWLISLLPEGLRRFAL